MASQATLYHFAHSNQSAQGFLSHLSENNFALQSFSDMSCLLAGMQDDADFDIPDAVLIDGTYLEEHATQMLDHGRQHDHFKSLPLIIFQDGNVADNLAPFIAAFSCFFLHPPYSEKMLTSVLKAAISDYRRWQKLRRGIETRTSAIGLIQSGIFHLKTHSEARNLTTMLSLACPEPDRVAIGLLELIANGIEHGNLGISFDEKTQLMQSGDWMTEIDRRQQTMPYADRQVEVIFAREDNLVRFRITDMGDGFNPDSYMEIDPSRMHLPHGRGIAMAKAASFDHVTYIGKGNCVEAIAYDPEYRETLTTSP